MDKVGDVIGNISRELDIEFDGDIQDNLMNLQGRESGGSNLSSGAKQQQQLLQQQKMQAELGEEEYEEDDEGEILDHNDVDIIDDGADYNGNDQMGSDDGERLLNR